MWGYVSGDVPRPITVVGNGVAAWLVAIREWTEQDLKARSDILLSISARELKHTRNCETSRELWEMLESTYAPKGPACMSMLFKQLLGRKMFEGGDVKEHIVRRVFEIVDKLAAMEVDINEKLLTIVLLQSLPMSFEGFRCPITSRDSLPEIELLKIKIVEVSESSIT